MKKQILGISLCYPILIVYLLAVGVQAAVTFSPTINTSYNNGAPFTNYFGAGNLNGGPVTADLYFSVPVRLENNSYLPYYSLSGWAFANVSGAAFNVDIFFSQPVTTFNSYLWLNGDNGQSSVDLTGDRFSSGQLSTVSSSATNPVFGDEIDLSYSDIGGFDRLSINMTMGSNGAAYWGMIASPIPEPSTFGLALGGLALGVLNRRRVKKS